MKTGEYKEIVSHLIINEFDTITLVYKNLRTDSFRIVDHHGQCELQTQISQITEKRLLRAMYNMQKIDPIGVVIDYEIPLKATKSAYHGDIDLLVIDGKRSYL